MTGSPWTFRLIPCFVGIFVSGLICADSFAQFGGGDGQVKADIHDGDRIALVGGTFIEREQQYGYFELALNLALPKTNFTVRNLGWSGDTVTAISRARFGNQQEAWSHLTKSLDLVDPTVIYVGYGTNEAFRGKEGLEEFKANYVKLLDELEKRTQRIVLIKPLPMENLGPPLPNPEEYNANIELYGKAIQQLAYDRGYRTMGMNDAFGKYRPTSKNQPEHLTDNGMHLTEYGYWYLAPKMVESLAPWTSESPLKAVAANPLKPHDKVLVSLPYASAPGKGFPHSVPCAIHFFQQGSCTLQGPGDTPAVTATTEQWGRGVDIPATSLYAKTEQLRQAILRKNQLFFDRFRPQNETYLYLFRKHEQGNNAVEIPQFDPLIEQQDKKIFELKQPVAFDVKFEKAAD
ncbi:GDSL-like Lipase/Acylhydrolase [Bremerella volcania]|uniref:GDSL-like Lipase/Acylhydrolase n=1 Tax=Bremerella volcania TaxID=2527984 RepID=A0A518CF05_9BACT|nr:SGNH/GDSL hydrolase family protein [Bremerella volcania]QDU77816.1 GDSL-like Lipase/Acylhydrolase [Bremerella volcania]